jgi:Tfp pilus assembly protein PilF
MMYFDCFGLSKVLFFAIYLQINDIALAAEDIANGLSLDPTDPELYIYRAMLNKMRYRPDDAKADAETAIKFGADPERIKKLL